MSKEKGVDSGIDLVSIATIQAVQGEKIETIGETCDEIKSCLLGNGNPGLVTRTDRLEQKDKAKTQFFWIIVTAVIGLVATQIVALVSK